MSGAAEKQLARMRLLSSGVFFKKIGNLYYCCKCPTKSPFLIVIEEHCLGHGAALLHKCNVCDYSTDERQSLIEHSSIHNPQIPQASPSKTSDVPISPQPNLSNFLNSVIVQPSSNNIPSNCREKKSDTQENANYNKRTNDIVSSSPEINSESKSQEYLFQISLLTNDFPSDAEFVFCKDDGAYHCCKCPTKAFNVGSIKYHMECHGANFPHKCNFCDFSCNNLQSLGIHHVYHKQKPKKPDCPTLFKSGIAKSGHIYKCLQCPALFWSPTSARRHSFCHGAGKEFQCSQCDYSTTRKKNYDKHGVVHSGEVKFPVKPIRKPYKKRKPHLDFDDENDDSLFDKGISFKCSKCPAVISYRYRMETHWACHGSENRFRCNYCDYAANGQDCLKAHHLLHENPQPFNVSSNVIIFDDSVSNPSLVNRIRLAQNSLRKRSQLPGVKQKYRQQFLIGKASKMGINNEFISGNPVNGQPTPDKNATEKLNASEISTLESNTEKSVQITDPGIPEEDWDKYFFKITNTSIKDIYQCRKCPSRSTKKMMLRHILCHGSEKRFECLHCDFSTVTSKNLIQHFIWHGIHVSEPNEVKDLLRQCRLKSSFCKKLEKKRKINKIPLEMDNSDISTEQLYNSLNETIDSVVNYGEPEYKEQEIFSEQKAPLPPPALFTAYKTSNVQATIFKCSKCPTIGFLGRIKKHVLFHGANLKFPCSICDFSSNYSTNLKKHIEKHHSKNLFLQEKDNYLPLISPPQTSKPDENNHFSFEVNSCTSELDDTFLDLGGKILENEEKEIEPYSKYLNSLSIRVNPKAKIIKSKIMVPYHLIKGSNHVYQCHNCPQQIKGNLRIKLHSTCHGSGGSFCCQFCDYANNNKKSFVQHLKSHESIPNNDFSISDNSSPCKTVMDSNVDSEMEEIDVENVDDSYNSNSIFNSANFLSNENIYSEILSNKVDNINKPPYFKISENLPKSIQYQCSKCPMRGSIFKMQRHERSHGCNRRYKCGICDYSCLTMVKLDNHYLWHQKAGEAIPPNEYLQNEDGKLCSAIESTFYNFSKRKGKKRNARFKIPKELRKTFYKMEGTNKYRCNKCPVETTYIYLMTRHVANHGSNKKFKCNYCDYSIDDGNQFEKHIILHQSNDAVLDQNEIIDDVKKTLDDHENEQTEAVSLRSTTDNFDCIENKTPPINDSKPEGDSRDIATIREIRTSSGRLLHCSNCPAKSVHCGWLARHILCHGAGRKFKCMYCDYSTDVSTNIHIHHKLHESGRDKSRSSHSEITNKKLENKKNECSLSPIPSCESLLPINNIKEPHTLFGSNIVYMKKRSGKIKQLKVPSHFQGMFQKVEGTTRYRCQKCPLETPTLAVLLKHLVCHEAARRFKCSFCTYSIHDSKHFKQHLSLHGLTSQEIDDHIEEILSQSMDENKEEAIIKDFLNENISMEDDSILFEENHFVGDGNHTKDAMHSSNIFFEEAKHEKTKAEEEIMQLKNNNLIEDNKEITNFNMKENQESRKQDQSNNLKEINMKEVKDQLDKIKELNEMNHQEINKKLINRLLEANNSLERSDLLATSNHVNTENISQNIKYLENAKHFPEENLPRLTNPSKVVNPVKIISPFKVVNPLNLDTSFKLDSSFKLQNPLTLENLLKTSPAKTTSLSSAFSIKEKTESSNKNCLEEIISEVDSSLLKENDLSLEGIDDFLDESEDNAFLDETSLPFDNVPLEEDATCDDIDALSSIKTLKEIKRMTLSETDGLEICALGYKCKKCPAANKNFVKMKVHIFCHGAKRRYLCSYCDYSIDSRKRMIQHKLLHTKEMTMMTRTDQDDCLDENNFTPDDDSSSIGLTPSSEKSMDKYGVLDENGEFNSDKIMASTLEESTVQSIAAGNYSSSFRNRFKRQSYINHRNNLIYLQNKKFHCKKCDFSTNGRGSYFFHVRMHRNEEMAYNHSQVDFKDGTSDISLDESQKLEEDDGKKFYVIDAANHLYQCKLCPAIIRGSGRVKIHTDCHGDNRRFKCEHCDYTTAARHNMETHVQLHRKRDHPIVLSPNKSPTDEAVEMWSLSRDRVRRKLKKEVELPNLQTSLTNILNQKGTVLCLDKILPVNKIETKINFIPMFQSFNKSYQCSKCPYTISTLDKMIKHCPTHEIFKKFICYHCPFSANDFQIMKRHAITHQIPNDLCEHEKDDSEMTELLITSENVFQNVDDQKYPNLSKHPEQSESNTANFNNNNNQMLSQNIEEEQNENVNCDKNVTALDFKDNDNLTKDDISSSNDANLVNKEENLTTEDSKYQNRENALIKDELSIKSVDISPFKKIGPFYQCSKCLTKMTLLLSIQQHVACHGVRARYLCVHCDFSVDNWHLIEQHAGVHNNQLNDFFKGCFGTIKKCEPETSTNDNFLKYLKIAKEFMYQCGECLQTCKSLRGMDFHIFLTHTLNKTDKINMCSFSHDKHKESQLHSEMTGDLPSDHMNIESTLENTIYPIKKLPESVMSNCIQNTPSHFNNIYKNDFENNQISMVPQHENCVPTICEKKQLLYRLISVDIYKCRKCPDILQSIDTTLQHASLHGQKFQHQCIHCDYSVNFFPSFQQHMKLHSTVKAEKWKSKFIDKCEASNNDSLPARSSEQNLNDSVDMSSVYTERRFYELKSNENFEFEDVEKMENPPPNFIIVDEFEFLPLQQNKFDNLLNSQMKNHYTNGLRLYNDNVFNNSDLEESKMSFVKMPSITELNFVNLQNDKSHVANDSCTLIEDTVHMRINDNDVAENDRIKNDITECMSSTECNLSSSKEIHQLNDIEHVNISSDLKTYEMEIDEETSKVANEILVKELLDSELNDSEKTVSETIDSDSVILDTSLSSSGIGVVGSTYSCFRCPFISSSKNTILSHVNGHLQRFLYKCVYCDFSTDLSNNVETHIRLHFTVPKQSVDAYVALKDNDIIQVKSLEQCVPDNAKETRHVFICSYCDREFFEEDSFCEHEVLHLNGLTPHHVR